MTRLARLSVILLTASSVAAVPTADALLLPETPAPFAEPWRLAQAAQQPASQPAMPVSLEQALYLIRSTLITLNDANRSGNYTVLRDLASPDFQGNNTAADLSQIFADLRKRNIDLHAVAIAAPQLSTPPHIDNNKMLRLTGFFPTKPLQINFDLLFQNVAGQWRLFGISVSTPAAQQPATSQTPPPAKPATSAPRSR